MRLGGSHDGGEGHVEVDAARVVPVCHVGMGAYSTRNKIKKHFQLEELLKIDPF